MRSILAQFQKQRIPTREPSDNHPARASLSNDQEQSSPTPEPSDDSSTDPASSLLKAALEDAAKVLRPLVEAPKVLRSVVDAPKVSRPLFGVPVKMVYPKPVSCSCDFPQQVPMLIFNS
jgi:hypothetical protein